MFRFNPAVASISFLAMCLSGAVPAMDDNVWEAGLNSASTGEVVIPAAISAPGAYGTQWESDSRFFNPCGEDLDVRLEFQPDNIDNAGEGLVSNEFWLLPNETRVFNGLFDTFPGLGGEEATGSIRIQSTSDSGCTVLLVSRTFNDTPDGTLGLMVPALPVEAPDDRYLEYPGLIQNDNYRTNLRLVNFSDATHWVAVTANDENGQPVGGSRSAKLLGRSTKQINQVADWLGAPDELAPFTLRVDVNGREIQAVATVVDNLTGDSVLYLSSFSDTNRLWLAGAASLSGVNESRWRTDLWLYNPTGDSLEGESEFFVGDTPSESYTFGWPALDALTTESYLDVVSDELGLEETRGYIVLTGDDGEAAPQVAARTYNLDPLGGTYGLNLRAYRSEDLLQPGEAGYISGVSNSPDLSVGFRTNLGFLNTSSSAWTTVRIAMFHLDGSSAADPYETNVPPGKMRQFNVFNKLGLGDVDMIGTIKFEVVSGGAMAVYATEIDNRTQDSIFIPAQRASYDDGCTYSVNPVSAAFDAGGGNGSFSVVTEPGCEWQVQSQQSWVSITNRIFHRLPGWVHYTVFSNTGPAREGTISAGRSTFRITQDAMPTELSISLPGDLPMELACIPPGTFQMGSPSGERGRRSNESLHEVTLTKGYCIGKHEVTQAQWVAIMDSNPSIGAGVGNDFPVFYVKWDEIAGPDGFVKKLNEHLENTGQSGAGLFRLPTEAEWEMAGRAGTQTRFSFGDGLECADDECGVCDLYDQNMWWCGNTDDHAEPVGAKPANAFGVYDMHGNMGEWVQDIWQEDLGTDPQTDPVGTGDDVRKVVKGGSYWNDPRFDRPAIRSGGYPTSAGRTTGFRIARALASPTKITRCGQTVVRDAVLVDDLVCDTGRYEEAGVTVGASYITVDLGGHVISGHPLGIGVSAEDVEGVTIKNGTIEDFLVGMNLVDVREVTVENLSISNLIEDDPDNFVPGLRITRSQNVVVRDSFFEFLPVFHKEAIVLATSEVIIDNIDVKDGSVGVNISSGSDQGIGGGSHASVINSRFVGVILAGVLVQWTDNARIADNEFIRCEEGVSVETKIPGGITGVTIEGNSISHGSCVGIHFMGNSDSEVRNNVIHDMGLGISLEPNMDCPYGPPEQCFFATDNVVSGNVVTGNDVDLRHDENAVGNTWENNTCETKEGAEIPACTAR